MSSWVAFDKCPRILLLRFAGFFHLAFASPARSRFHRGGNMSVDKWEQRRFDVELQIHSAIFWSVAFEFQFLSCGQHATCLGSWQCILTSQIAIPLHHCSHLNSRHVDTQVHTRYNNFHCHSIYSICILKIVMHEVPLSSFIILHHPSSSYIFFHILFDQLSPVFFRATLSCSYSHVSLYEQCAYLKLNTKL